MSLRLLSKILCFIGKHNWNIWVKFPIKNPMTDAHAGSVVYRRCRECMEQDERVVIHDMHYEEIATLYDRGVNGRETYTQVSPS